MTSQTDSYRNAGVTVAEPRRKAFAVHTIAGLAVD